ncbi:MULTISPECIES: hypothetical protein [Mesorhizobium]|uniref:Uncharacterized protein n=4 Tax=Mesorhizobium TaxID=68287 RepID=A0AB38T8N6_9HYPH|nr:MULTISPECIES: hypothetical protein [Mesorhizobium]MDF3217935.1 hypothetical protein [Mesorhizobium ciceri]UTU50702.1 hypothetical protein LRP29_24955 [Mesorhizobium ciceri]
MRVVGIFDRHFDRRLKAAKAGLHLPSEEELLRGMNFFGDRLEDDIREYASRLSRRMKKRGRVELLALANCLDDLATEQSEDGVKSVEAALDTAEVVKGIPAEAWLMTANEVGSVPAVMRDRCRILRFPEPGPDQLPFLAPRILERLYLEAGHDPRWAAPIEGFELAALASNWPGGSIRKLERLVEKLVEARERHWGRQ